MVLTKSRQALKELLIDFLIKESRKRNYDSELSFDVGFSHEFSYYRDGSDIEVSVYDYPRGRTHTLYFSFGCDDAGEGIYCTSTRKGYNKDGNYDEYRYKLLLSELDAPSPSKFDNLIGFISSDDLVKVFVYGLKEVISEGI